MTYQDRIDIDNLYELIWDNETDQTQFITREEFEEFKKVLKLVESNITISGEIENYSSIMVDEFDELNIIARWVDNEDNDRIRPPSTNVNVDKDTIILSDANNWNTTLNVLAGSKPKISSYVDNYSTNITNYENKYLIEYIHSDETMDLEVLVNIDSGAGFEMTFDLYKNGNLYSSQYGEYIFNNYSILFYDLPVFDDGDRNQYTIQVSSPDGYRTPVISGSQDQGYTVHMIKYGGYVDIDLEIVVDKTIHPTEIKTYLFRVSDDLGNTYNIYPKYFTETANSEQFHYRAKYKKKFDMGSYTITPVGFENLISDCTLFNPDAIIPTDIVISANADNQYVEYNFIYYNNTPDEDGEPLIPKTPIVARANWDDDNNSEGLRPSSVTAHLTAGGEEIGSCVLNEANNWTYSFGEHPIYGGDDPINYAIDYTVVDGYSVEYHGYEITYALIIERVNKRLVISWDDAGYESNRPSEITAMINPLGYILKPSPVNGWDVIATGLPKYNQGQEINYEWAIGEVSNYVSMGSDVRDETTTIILKFMPTIPDLP